MSNFARSLVTPAIRWLGVHPSELQNKKIGTLKLTSHDKAKLRKLSKKEYISSNKNLLNEVRVNFKLIFFKVYSQTPVTSQFRMMAVFVRFSFNSI